MTELIKAFKELDDLRVAEEVLSPAVKLGPDPITGVDFSGKLCEIQSSITKTKAEIDEMLATMRDEKKSVTLTDVVDLINIGRSGPSIFETVVYVLDETSSAVTVDIAELLLNFSLTIPADEGIYKDLIYILSRTVDTVTENSHLTDIAISL